jgi:hypothetical protein
MLLCSSDFHLAPPDVFIKPAGDAFNLFPRHEERATESGRSKPDGGGFVSHHHRSKNCLGGLAKRDDSVVLQQDDPRNDCFPFMV